MKLSPFKAHLYDDPDGSDGVVDISGILQGSGSLSPRQLKQDPSTWDEWNRGGFLRQTDTSGLYMFRSGRPNGTQATGFFARNLDNPVLQPTATFGFFEMPSSELVSVLSPEGMPLVRATASDSTHYRVWQVTASAVIELLCESMASITTSTEPLVVVATDSPPPEGLIFLT